LDALDLCVTAACRLYMGTRTRVYGVSWSLLSSDLNFSVLRVAIEEVFSSSLASFCLSLLQTGVGFFGARGGSSEGGGFYGFFPPFAAGMSGPPFRRTPPFPLSFCQPLLQISSLVTLVPLFPFLLCGQFFVLPLPILLCFPPFILRSLLRVGEGNASGFYLGAAELSIPFSSGLRDLPGT